MRNPRGTICGALIAAVLLVSSGTAQGASFTTTVPNTFRRTCSRIIVGHCSRDKQVNGTYVRGIPSLYYTTYCYCLVW